jgi:hypothetical protein
VSTTLTGLYPRVNWIAGTAISVYLRNATPISSFQKRRHYAHLDTHSSQYIPYFLLYVRTHGPTWPKSLVPFWLECHEANIADALFYNGSGFTTVIFTIRLERDF